MKSRLLLAAVLAAGSATAVPMVFASQNRVTLCHKAGSAQPNNTLTVAQPAAQAHFNHGDSPGPCPASPSS